MCGDVMELCSSRESQKYIYSHVFHLPLNIYMTTTDLIQDSLIPEIHFEDIVVKGKDKCCASLCPVQLNISIANTTLDIAELENLSQSTHVEQMYYVNTEDVQSEIFGF